jgi:uncharacterized protein
MELLQRITLMLAVALGHYGWWVFAYNRINATGLPRRIVKFFERGVFLPITLLLPIAIVGIYFLPLSRWLFMGEPLSQRYVVLWLYIVFCLAVVVAIGPLWLYSRLFLFPPKHLLEETSVNRINLREQEGEICGSQLVRRFAQLPGNCILELHSTRKSLALEAWPQYLNGFRIGHLSDLHFTGQLSQSFYHQAIAELNSLRPDMIMITGDIIDKAKCLPWIEEVLGSLRAPHGCYFVLGNHDKRLASPDHVRSLLENHGWIDLGSKQIEIDLHGHRILLAGHERPWFGIEPNFSNALAAMPTESDAGETRAFRMALAHSPDAIDWAQQEKVDLLLAGHTHGGQIRFPVIGPIVAPSWYGSQFASGVFYRHPTLMHVSRGLAGVHPLRFRCAPEIALLELYQSVSSKA